MGPPLMVVIDILAQYLAKVVLIDYNDVVEHLPAKCADQPFHERILPRRPRGSDDTFNTQACDPTLHHLPVNRVAISD